MKCQHLCMGSQSWLNVMELCDFEVIKVHFQSVFIHPLEMPVSESPGQETWPCAKPVRILFCCRFQAGILLFFLHFQGIVSVKIIKPVDTSNSVVISFLKTAPSYVVCFDNHLLEETALIHRLLSSWALSYTFASCWLRRCFLFSLSAQSSITVGSTGILSPVIHVTPHAEQTTCAVGLGFHWSHNSKASLCLKLLKSF